MFFVQYRGNRKSHLSRVKNAKFPARFQALSGEGALLFQNILLLLYTILLLLQFLMKPLKFYRQSMLGSFTGESPELQNVFCLLTIVTIVT